TFQPIWVANYAKERAKLDALRQQVEDGVLTLRVADVLQMDDAAEAHRKMEAGGTRGRIVLEFGDIPWTQIVTAATRSDAQTGSVTVAWRMRGLPAERSAACGAP